MSGEKKEVIVSRRWQGYIYYNVRMRFFSSLEAELMKFSSKRCQIGRSRTWDLAACGGYRGTADSKAINTATRPDQ
jgi:hypothetical protein